MVKNNVASSSTKDEDIEYDFLVPKQENLVGKQE